MGAKNKTQENPEGFQQAKKIAPQKSHAEFPSLKNFKKAKQVWPHFIHRTTRPGYAGTTTNLQIVLSTP